MAKQAKARTTPRDKVEALLRQNATTGPEQLYETGAFGGRNTVYDACSNGTIECFRMGKRIIIPTAPLRKKLGIEAA
jgi:hypothetical protein